MTRSQATTEARAIANRDQIIMVVTENPYHEGPEDERFNYHPRAAASIFTHEEVVETLSPEVH
jgi:hypothetical protein